MASLENRNGTYRIVFRFAGERFSRSLKTSDATSASLSLARLEDNLRRLELGTLTLEAGDDVASVLLSSGNVTSRPTITRSPPLGPLLDRFIASVPEGAIEPSTCSMLKTHVGNLKRVIGTRKPIAGLTFEAIQEYVNARSRHKGHHGQAISVVTIKKELTTLYAAWKWAKVSGAVSTDLPDRSRLRFPKLDEKPPFKTWPEIERLIGRGGLTEDEARVYWDCVYLSRDEIDDLLIDIEDVELPAFVLPMFAFAAFTGARRSEMLRSQIQDIDLETGHIMLREKKRVRGQRSTRSVPVSERLAVHLEQWLNRHPGGRFTFTLDGQSLTRNQAHNYFERAVSNSKWHVLRGWHVLRHSFISNCASNGVDQRMIDDWVGHQTDEMRRRYRHLFPNRQKEAIAKAFG